MFFIFMIYYVRVLFKMNVLLEKAKKIQCLICDVDGVLTDGKLYLNNDANEHKAFHVHDGMGLKLLMAAGIQVAVITTSRNAVIDHRMQQLGITHYFKGQVNKDAAYEELKARLGFQDEGFAYIGDDLPDLGILRHVGLSVAVSNAQDAVKESVNWITHFPGGNGAVRELCNFILKAQNKETIAIKRYLSQ